jgi:hypothetical protein
LDMNVITHFIQVKYEILLMKADAFWINLKFCCVGAYQIREVLSCVTGIGIYFLLLLQCFIGTRFCWFFLSETWIINCKNRGLVLNF